ncbi:MAG: hypothetical protein ACOYD0_13085 [Candidatus Nanopelagicales bacterium]
MDILRTLIRPGLTVAFFTLFAGMKIYAIYHGISVDGNAVKDILPIVWDESTGELFGIVIGWWFGSRLPKK